MPIYEYVCPACNSRFELLRSRSECNLGAPCPDCESSAERTLSSFSHYAAEPANSAVRKQDKMKQKMWESERKMEDDKIKNPDPLKGWREERQKTLKKGPEAWTNYANEIKAKEQKKKDYGENWLGREV
jgi:putative FmdB family regulatory protein